MAVSWYSKTPLSDMSIKQLDFWSDNIKWYTSRSLVQTACTKKVVYSDASDSGYAGYCVDGGCVASHGEVR